MGRDVEYPLDSELERNLSQLLAQLNLFRRRYGSPMIVNSGYRPGKYNGSAGGSRKSAHLTCQACDFLDKDRRLTNWILANPHILEECNLWMEDPRYTPTWVHLQIRPVASGNRIFKP